MIRQRLCTLTLGFLIGVGAEASTVTDLSVTVKIKGSGDPLAGATVVASESSYAETDGQGQVVLIGVEVPTQVKVLAAGFETLRVDLTEGAPITVYLIPHAYQADGLEVIEERVQEKVSKVVLSAEELKRAPGTGGDAVKVVQSLPGVVNAGEGTGLMYMRGSGSRDNSYWVNGLPIDYLYHMGGIQSTVNPALVQDFNVFLGGFPVEYGDNLGGTIDVRLRAPKSDRLHQTYNIGTLQSSFLVEGPVGDSGNESFYVAARRSYLDLVVTADDLNNLQDNKDGEPSNEITTVPRFYDAQAAWRHQLDRGAVELHYFAAGDEVALLNNKSAGTDPELAGEMGVKLAYQTVGTNWHEQWNQRWGHQLVFSLAETSEHFKMGTDPNGKPYYAYARSQSARLQPEFSWRPADNERYAFGADLEYLRFPLQLYVAEPPAPGQVDYDYSTAPKHRVDRTIDATLAAPFAKYTHTWGDLTAAFGLRYSRFKGTGRIGDETVSPRMSLEYALTDKTLLTAAWGRFVQPPRATYLLEELGNPSLVYTKAEHRIIGVKHQVAPRWSLQLDLYHKPMTDLVVGTANSPPDNYVNRGSGEAYGADLLIKRQGGDGKLGWLSYSYAKSHRTNDLTGKGYAFEGDQPHTLTLVWSQPFTGNWDKWSWGVRANAHTGLPYTPIVDRKAETLADGRTRFRPIYGGANSKRLPAYYRLDLRLDRRVLYNSSTLDFYFDMENITFHKNVVGYDYGSQLQNIAHPKDVTGTPFMLYFGVETTF